MNKFNEKKFLDVCNSLNSNPLVKDICIRYETDKYFNKIKRLIQKDRRGEVVFCVIRPNKKIITIRSNDYLNNIYRIPTGGINFEEDIIEALHRETKEELGLEVKISSFAGLLKISFEHGNEKVMFYSYLFILEEIGGRLLLDATDNEVTGVNEVDIAGLEVVVNSLKDIEHRWKDWGMFRYETSNFILEYLKNNPLGVS